jgi:glycerol-3-phosphate dehydrogenase
MAERIVDRVIDNYFDDRNLRPCITDSLKLVGADFDEPEEVKQYIQEVFAKLHQHGLEEYTKYLVYNYGKNTTTILNHIEQNFQGFSADTLIKAECWYTTQFEMVVTLLDFFNRRTGMLYFDIERTMAYKALICDEIASILQWDESRSRMEEERLEHAIFEATSFKNKPGD